MIVRCQYIYIKAPSSRSGYISLCEIKLGCFIVCWDKQGECQAWWHTIFIHDHKALPPIVNQIFKGRFLTLVVEIWLKVPAWGQRARCMLGNLKWGEVKYWSLAACQHSRVWEQQRLWHTAHGEGLHKQIQNIRSNQGSKGKMCHNIPFINKASRGPDKIITSFKYFFSKNKMQMLPRLDGRCSLSNQFVFTSEICLTFYFLL